MKIAVVTLATGEYWRGAKVLFHTLRKYGKMPDSVVPIVMGMNRCDFAVPMPIATDYSWVPVSAVHFPKVADKFFALTLDYDRIVLIDADEMCMGDCSYLWSEHVGTLPFYACRDTASDVYYRGVVREIGLNPDLLFNAGVMVFHRVDAGDILTRVASGELVAFDGGDQGYLNHYFQKVRPGRAGWLPSEYNCCLDVNCPQVPDHAKRLVHFTGGNANPWNHRVPASDWRTPYLAQWQQAWEDCR